MYINDYHTHIPLADRAFNFSLEDGTQKHVLDDAAKTAQPIVSKLLVSVIADGLDSTKFHEMPYEDFNKKALSDEIILSNKTKINIM